MKNTKQQIHRFFKLFYGGYLCLQQHGFLYTLRLFLKKLARRTRKLFPLQPKISIIVPVYNVEAYLPACLSSCINQTMEEIEIICVNDGSTDNSKRVLRKFARNDRRIKVIHKKNGGLSSARNAGLDYFRGEVVMFLDSDDYLAPNACERVWTEMQKQPTDILIFGTQIFPAIPKAPDWYSRTLNVTDHRYTKPGAEVLFTEHCSKPFVWRQAFSGRILKEKNVRFYPEITYGEDIAFQMIIFPYAKNFSFISDKLYYYRWYRENSLMRQHDGNLETTLCAHLKFAWLITEYWQQHGWLPTWGMKYTRWLLQFLYLIAHIQVWRILRNTCRSWQISLLPFLWEFIWMK